MQGILKQLRLYLDSLQQAVAFHKGVIHQLNNAIYKEYEVICIYLHSGNNCIRWAALFLHLPSFQMNSSGISPYRTLNGNENPWFHIAVMNPNKLVCLSTAMKLGMLSQGTLCSSHICSIHPCDFSPCKGRCCSGWYSWETLVALHMQAHLPLLHQAGGYTGISPVFPSLKSFSRWAPLRGDSSISMQQLRVWGKSPALHGCLHAPADLPELGEAPLDAQSCIQSRSCRKHQQLKP